MNSIARRGTDDGLPIVLWDAADFDCPDIGSLVALLARNRDRIDDDISTRGGVLMRGFTFLKTAEDFERALGALSSGLMDYVGGTSPRSVVRGRVMTSTEVPRDYSIPLHQEMSYTGGAPDRIAFFCEVEPDAGGATTIGDMRRVTERIDPAVLARFKAHGGLVLYRNLPSREDVSQRPGVPKAWQEVFGTDDREEADRIVEEAGWRSEWQGDGALRLWQDVRPATRVHERTGTEVWYNQVHIFTPSTALRWAMEDGRIGAAERMRVALERAPDLVDTVLFGDGTPIPEGDVMHIYETLQSEARPLRWRRGDVVVLDNVLTAHGREAFSGDRRILTALIRT